MYVCIDLCIKHWLFAVKMLYYKTQGPDHL